MVEDTQNAIDLGFETLKIKVGKDPALGQYDPVKSGVLFNNAEITISDLPGLGISKIDNLVMLDV